MKIKTRKICGNCRHFVHGHFSDNHRCRRYPREFVVTKEKWWKPSVVEAHYRWVNEKDICGEWEIEDAGEWRKIETDAQKKNEDLPCIP